MMMQTTSYSGHSAFLSLAARLHPGLDGTVVPSAEGRIRPGDDNTPVIQAVFDVWAHAFPEAGQPYAAVRTWTLLIWQPVFLAVVGVHGAGVVAPVDRLWQRAEQGVVAGFRLQRDWPPAPDSESERIREAAARLLSVRDALLADLGRVTRIKPLTANRLMADTLLIALRRLSEVFTGFGNGRLRGLGDAWLAATDLRQQSRYLPLRPKFGREVLGLERRACCMHYRRADGYYCSSCPRLDHTERERRQLEELSHEAVAV